MKYFDALFWFALAFLFWLVMAITIDYIYDKIMALSERWNRARRYRKQG